jgi:hypothetical protein
MARRRLRLNAFGPPCARTGNEGLAATGEFAGLRFLAPAEICRRKRGTSFKESTESFHQIRIFHRDVAGQLRWSISADGPGVLDSLIVEIVQRGENPAAVALGIRGRKEGEVSMGESPIQEAIAECERQIAKLEDPRWPWLMEAVRQGVLVNKRQYQGVEYAAEITIAIDQDYLSFLQSILGAADLHARKPDHPEAQVEPTRPKDGAPNAENLRLGDQRQSGG